MGGSLDVSSSDLNDWDDAFGNQVSDRTNVLDLAAHYPYSPERWRIFVDGTRQFPSYDTVAQYNHTGDYHELKPAAGETVTFQSAERPRYVVQYELAATFAFQVNQDLATGDSIRIGLYDGSNGWYIEQDGDHEPTRADAVLERDGTEVYRKTDVPLHVATTHFARLKLQTGWYDVTRQIWERSFSDDGEQKNRDVAQLSADGERGSKTGNLPIHFSVTASGSTSDLVLEAGSAAQVNLGSTTPLQRSKFDAETDAIDTTGTWVPIRAYRTDPDHEIINEQVNTVDIALYSSDTTVELLLQSYGKENVADANGDPLVDSDFSTPPEMNSQNNNIETTSAIEQVANGSGTLQTSVDDVGGFQIGRDILPAGGGNSVSGDTTTPTNIKRPVYPDDYLVVLGKSSKTGDVSYQIQFEQDW